MQKAKRDSSLRLPARRGGQARNDSGSLNFHYCEGFAGAQVLGWDAASISFFTAAAGIRMSCAFGLAVSESAEFNCDCWSVASGLPVAIASRARRPAVPIAERSREASTASWTRTDFSASGAKAASFRLQSASCVRNSYAVAVSRQEAARNLSTSSEK